MLIGGRLGELRISRLTLVKVALVLYVLGMFVTGKKPALWPIVNWPMYSERQVAYPSPVTSVMEIAAVLKNGRVQMVPMRLLVSVGRMQAMEPMLRCSAGLPWEKRGWPYAPTSQSRCQRYVGELVSRNLAGKELEAVEIWRIDWAVDPTGSPPVVRDAPIKRELLIRFPVTPEIEN